MKFSRRCSLLLLAACLVLLASAPAIAKEKWINVRTKGFNVVSNASSDDARRLALKLEQFRAVFAKLFKIEEASPVPITVLAFKNDGSFKPFKPLYNGKPANVSGYFQPGEDENMIALDIASSEEHPLHVILHEYTHLLTAYNTRAWPLWLNEGIAELYSTFEIKGKEVTFGIPVSSHVFLLRENKFVPLQALFNVGHNSPIYNERDKQSIFYAESWALAHYLMYGDKSAHHDQLIEFIKLFESGMELERAFTTAFKTDFATLEKTLRHYIGNNSYPGVTYTLDNTEGDKEITERPLTEAEAQYYLGDLLLHINRIDDAENLFKQAQSLDTSLSGPHEGLGMVAMRRNQFPEALAQFKEAATHGSKNHLMHYYYAEALQRQLMGSSNTTSGITADAAKTIITELNTSISLMPSFALAYNLKAFTQLLTGENLKEALASARAALRLEPQSKPFALTLAQIQLRMQDYTAARKTLEPLLVSEDATYKQQAQSILNYIEAYMRASAEQSSAPSTARDVPTGDPVGVAGDQQPSQPPRLKRRDEGEDKSSVAPPTAGRDAKEPDSEMGPTLKPAGTQVMNGTLVGMECGNGMVLVFRSAGKLLRFAVSDPNALQFYTQDPQFNPQINCGPMNIAAFVHYKPLATASGQFAGDAVVVEFKKRTK